MYIYPVIWSENITSYITHTAHWHLESFFVTQCLLPLGNVQKRRIDSDVVRGENYIVSFTVMKISNIDTTSCLYNEVMLVYQFCYHVYSQKMFNIY